ncbi:MmcB family DNA repair protein [Parerythrobacter jejuensis]|uniref:MmcB family DNA repair protein n=1 Tax=Parerythrobacter jejuensis TaxID=795812 RepID=A0A845ASC1_9SPHN|nr:MmcB family DNA repair protein [Parerythrobacter jejuensis]MXP31022.1 MmcB family DNA repair protein [Parerythrobacter jejuensis]MXP33782.1 MmcB family DNA repair protein [Parerythrobacter jejuensis]
MSPTIAPPTQDPSPAEALAVDSAAVARGIMRLFARNNIWSLAEMPLKGGRRADLMGVDPKGQVVIVEIKVARADLLGDNKWPDYLDHCDRFYWGIAPHIDHSPLETDGYRPEDCGIIVADGYDAEIVRPAPTRPLAAARRKVEIERLSRAAMRRLTVLGDPHCEPWGLSD